MDISINRENDCAIFQINEDIDEAGASALQKCFGELDKNGLSELRLDFSGVKYIGSSGIGQLILFYKQMASGDGKVCLVNVSTEIGDLLRDLDIDKVISING